MLRLHSKHQTDQQNVQSDRTAGLYVCDDEDLLSEHALRNGLPIDRIMEVTAFIGPASYLIS